MRAKYLNHTRRNHGQVARSSTCCGRQVISTGRFSRRRRSSSSESAQAFSDSEPTLRYAMQTVEAGFPTRTTPSRWSTRSNSRAIPGADSQLATDAARSRKRTREHVSAADQVLKIVRNCAKTRRAGRPKHAFNFRNSVWAPRREVSHAESKDCVVSHHGCGAIGLRKSRRKAL